MGPIAGVLIDRFNRRNLAVIACLGSATVATLLPVAHNTAGMLTAAFFAATATSVAVPSLHAALPQIVEKNRLLEANSFISATDSVARFAVPAFSGAVVGALGTAAGFYAAAAAYFLAACALLPLRLPDPLAAENRKALTVRAAAGNLVEGVRYLVGSRLLLWTAVVLAGVMFADSTVTPLFTIMVKNELGVPPSYIGYLSSGYGVGVLAGALLLPLLKLWAKERLLLPLGALAIGAQMLAYSQIRAFWMALPLQVTCGIGFAFLLNTVQTVVQQNTAGNLLGRVSAAVSALSSFVCLFGVKAGGFVSDTLGVRMVFLGAGVICVLTGLSHLGLTSFGKGLKAAQASGD